MYINILHIYIYIYILHIIQFVWNLIIFYRNPLVISPGLIRDETRGLANEATYKLLLKGLHHWIALNSLEYAFFNESKKGLDAGDFLSDICFIWLKSFLYLPKHLVVWDKIFLRYYTVIQKQIFLMECNHTAGSLADVHIDKLADAHIMSSRWICFASWLSSGGF